MARRLMVIRNLGSTEDRLIYAYAAMLCIKAPDLLSTANIAISYTTHQRPSLVSQPELVLRALATPQPDHLPVLLQLRDELIADSDNIVVLFVLVVTSLCLDHSSHAIDHAW